MENLAILAKTFRRLSAKLYETAGKIYTLNYYLSKDK